MLWQIAPPSITAINPIAIILSSHQTKPDLPERDLYFDLGRFFPYTQNMFAPVKYLPSHRVRAAS